MHFFSNKSFVNILAIGHPEILCTETQNKQTASFSLLLFRSRRREEKREYLFRSFGALRVMSARQNPNDFLKTLLGRPVVVKLNSGVDYRGVLSCLDGE